MKKRLSTIMMLAVLIVGSTTTAWAGELFSGTVTGGQLSFYSDAACANEISEAKSGSTVYIRAIPDYGYTGIGATLSALPTVGSDQAESRRATSSDIPFGETFDVATFDNSRGIYSLTMPDNTNVTVSATFETVTATSVSYVDENNETQTVEAVALDLTMTALAADQWYVLESDLTFTSGFTGTGNMCMVVPDGVTLTVGTESSPVQDDAFNTGRSVFLYGQENATGKLSVNTTKYGVNIGGSYVIANLNIDVTSGYSAFNCGSNGSGCVIAGHPSKGNTVTVSAGSNGIYAGGTPLVIKYCNVDVVANGGSGVYAGGGSLTIEGLADGSNYLKVRSSSSALGSGGYFAIIRYCDIDAVSTNSNGIVGNGNGIYIEGIKDGGNNVTVRSAGDGINGGGCPVTIQNCTVDVTAKGQYGILASGGNGVTIDGFADGSNDVTVRCATYGIYAGGCSVTINNCDLTLTGLYDETTGEYGFCSAGGIFEGSGSGIKINGCASGNNVTIRGNGNGGIFGSGCGVAIKNCSVDINSKSGGYGIYANGGNGLTIEGLEDGSSYVTVRCPNNGLYGWGYAINITNCDVTVTGSYNEETNEYGCGVNGIYVSGGSTLNIIGCASGNNVTVRSGGSGAIYAGGCPVNIKNCSVDVTSPGGYGIFATSGITIEGLEDGSSDVTVRCPNNGIYGSGCSVNITNCDVTVTGMYNNETNEYGYCSSGGIYEGGGSGINIIGCASGNTVTVRGDGNGAIYGSGCAVAISNCDVDLMSTNGYGIYATSGNGLSLVSTLEEGNKAKVVSKNPAMQNHGISLTIGNYTVEINSEGYGIYNTSTLNINNSDITVESVRSGLYAVGSGNTITDSRLKVTTTGTKQEDDDAYTYYDGIYAPNGFTVNGGQLDVTAEEGYYGVNLASEDGVAYLGWNKATDYFKASSYYGTVKVAEEQMLTDGNWPYINTLTADEKDAINGVTLRPGVFVTFAPAGYATYYDSNCDLMLPEGMQARVVTAQGATAGTLTYVTVADGDTDQNIVPAGTAVMLKTDAVTDVEQTLPVVIGSGADAYSGSNLLSGSDTDTEILTATGYAFYKLAYGPDNTTFGWYWGAEDGQPFTSPAHKAWLTLPASVDARFLGLPEGDATAIAAAAQERVGKDGAWYTIGGVKLNGQPTAKGIYIKDGKKVVIK